MHVVGMPDRGECALAGCMTQASMSRHFTLRAIDDSDDHILSGSKFFLRRDKSPLSDLITPKSQLYG